MTFEDTTLIRLADPATRAAVFDEIALEQFLNAGYDTSLTPVSGPFSAVFEELRLGVPVLPVSLAEASWGPQGSSERSSGTLQIAGLGAAAIIADAFWRGAIVTRTGAATGRIVEVAITWPSPDDVDEEIAIALGALPADPRLLQTERRTRFLAKLQAGMSSPDALTDDVLAALLARAGATDLNDLFDRHRGVTLTGVVRITIEETPAPPPSPKALPIAAAILVRSAAVSLGTLLAQSRIIRERLQAEGMSRPDDPQFRSVQSVLIVWVIPLAVFDDDGWPGALAADAPALKRTKRRTAAGQWLAREGIGLAAVS